VDIKAYISSGILEQYAFDLLSPGERSEVEANVQQHPELAEELRQIEYTIEKYLSLYQAPVSPDFRERLDKRLEDITPDPLPRSTSTPATGATGNSLNYGLLGFLIVSLIATAWMFYKNQEQDVAYAELQAEYNTLKQECDETEDLNRNLLIKLEMIRQTGNLFIQMRGTDNAPAAIASVLYNPETETSYLDVVDLPTPPTDKQYQLWAIVDGTPVDMGVFDVEVDTVSGLQEVPFIADAQAFAVTLEPRGGSEVPTLEEMVTIGNVAG
jgi:anti-sigma-K factor RskA